MAAAGGLTIYAFSIGLVAAVNPCGFPLLPAYLTVSGGGQDDESPAVRVLRALGSGAAMTAGFIVVFGLLGLGAEAGLGLAYGWVPWVMIPVGVAFAAYGVLILAGRGLYLRSPTRRLLAGRRRGVALFGFGVTYAVASLACSLPLFLTSVAGLFTTRGVRAGLADGVAYALGMGLVICTVSLAGAGAKQLRLRRLRALQPGLQRVAGALLAAVGAYLVLYWVAYVATPLSQPAPVRWVEHFQTVVQGWLSTSPRLTGIVVGALVLVALIAASVHGLRPPPSGRQPATAVPSRTSGPS